jgi:hypothetical protein
LPKRKNDGTNFPSGWREACIQGKLKIPGDIFEGIAGFLEEQGHPFVGVESNLNGCRLLEKP